MLKGIALCLVNAMTICVNYPLKIRINNHAFLFMMTGSAADASSFGVQFDLLRGNLECYQTSQSPNTERQQSRTGHSGNKTKEL